MSEALFTLGSEGKRVLERTGAKEIRLERRPPLQTEHFLGINDLRIAAELVPDLSYFFAYWELPGIGWQHRIIPDALFSVGPRTFALEFDRGQENVRFFIKTKIDIYRHGLLGTPLHALIIVTDRRARLDTLMSRIGLACGFRVLFSTLELIRARGLKGPVFFVEAQREATELP